MPILLAALTRRIEWNRLERLTAMCETAVIRRSLAEQPANRLERESGELCRLIREETDPGEAVGRVIEVLRRLAADGQDPDPFPSKSLSPEKAKHILLSLENYVRLKAGKEETLLDPDKVDIEHVLPQSPVEKSWPLAVWGDAERQGNYTARLGNFALLARNANRAVGNATFNCGNEPGTVKCCKRHTYRNSELLLTRAIADFDEWNPASIDARQGELARLAQDVWAYKT